MANSLIIPKRVAINKANAQIVIIVAVAAFVTVFCLVASKALLSEYSYQQRVISAQDATHKQLLSNISGYTQLINSYETFNSNSTNIIGGSTTGNSDNSGNNAKIVLDALPPKYDFPGLVTSLNNLFVSQGIPGVSIGGTDQQLTEENNSSSPSPSPVAIPITISLQNSNYATAQKLVSVLKNSIRPIQVNSISLSGGVNNMEISIDATTYFQPSKNLGISEETIQ